MYIRQVKSLNENSKIGKEIIASLQDAVLQEAKKKKRKQKSALSPFCYLGREEKKKEPEVKTDAGNVEQGIEFFNSTFNTGENSVSISSNEPVVSTALGEAKEHLKPIEKGATFIRTKKFDISAKKLNMTEQDIEDLKETICSVAPEASLGKSLYKIRFAPKYFSKGKSTSYRNIYYKKKDNLIYLLYIYNKSNQSNIDKKEEKEIIKIVKQIDGDNK